MELSTERPIFVCGVPKSGTTLVGQILSNHPDLQTDFDITHSIGFLSHVEKTTGDYYFCCEQQPLLVAQDKYWSDDDFREWHLVNMEYFKNLHVSYRAGAPRWGSSSCLTHRYRDMLWKWFPEAIFLIVKRDPRDQWSSFKHLFTRGADSWERYIEYRNSIPKTVTDERLFVVEYHEVVNDPAIVFDILGLSVPENYLNGVVEVFISRTNGSKPGELMDQLRTGDKLIQTRVGRWKRDLSEEEIAKCTEAFPEECAYYDSLDL